MEVNQMEVKNVNEFRSLIANSLKEVFYDVREFDRVEYEENDYNKDEIRRLYNPIQILDGDMKEIMVLCHEKFVYILIPNHEDKVFNLRKFFDLEEEDDMQVFLMKLAVEIYKLL
jgi:hypothetical protein